MYCNRFHTLIKIKLPRTSFRGIFVYDIAITNAKPTHVLTMDYISTLGVRPAKEKFRRNCFPRCHSSGSRYLASITILEIIQAGTNCTAKVETEVFYNPPMSFQRKLRIHSADGLMLVGHNFWCLAMDPGSSPG